MPMLVRCSLAGPRPGVTCAARSLGIRAWLLPQRVNACKMQSPWSLQRDVARRFPSAKAQTNEALASQSAPETGVAAETGNPEAALLQRDQGNGGGPDGNVLAPQLYLLGSAVLWGTSAPAMRYLFLQGEGQAPTPSVVAAVQTTAAALCLLLLDLGRKQVQRNSKMSSQMHAAAVQADDDYAAAEAAAAPVVEPASSAWPVNIFLTATASSVAFAGFELGLWAFIANCSTIIGFEHTATSRGTFLLRLSAMFTPLVAALAGERFPLPVWLGCFAAFTGGVLISCDSSSTPGDAGNLLALSSGDFYILFAALMWSVQTVSVGRHAPNFAPIALAKFQLATMSLFSALWLAYNTVTTAQSGVPLTHLWGGYDHAMNWGILLIPAIGPWGIGTALQAKGQARVSSAVAMVILSTDPVWATLFAGLVGSNEQHLGLLGWLGAASILSASVIASFGK